MERKKNKPPATTAISPATPHPDAAAFKNLQIDLFQTFLCNTDEERERLSNTMDLWDSIPRYSFSRQAMAKMRTDKGFLDLLKLDFNYKGMALKAIIQPARIEDADGTAQDYYPSANEELVEDALRKIAAEQCQGYFDKPNFRCGVVFTLHMLRTELKKMGHARSYQQIVLSLNILSGSVIELRTADGKSPEASSRSPYFPSLSAVSRQRLASDPDAKWVVQFHPLVTQSIDAIAYRPFNYQQMMSHTTQLARWLHKQLALKFTFASLITTFETRYSTIKRDSGLLQSYTRERAAIDTLDTAIDELKCNGVLSSVQKKEIRGARSKLEDVVYILAPSRDFVSHAKAANKRHADATEKLARTEEKQRAPFPIQR